jgi:hypothetical protein
MAKARAVDKRKKLDLELVPGNTASNEKWLG